MKKQALEIDKDFILDKESISKLFDLFSEGRPEFMQRHEPPFTWTTVEWQGGDLCRVSIDFVEAFKNGKVLLPGDEFRTRQFRFRVYNVLLFQSTYECIRISGRREEAIMAIVCIIQDIIVSPFQYYFRKSKHDHPA